MSKPTNLLFVMTDHQRADSLGLVQAGVEAAPNLNRLAAEGAVFSRAYNACPLCAPARTALATSKHPTRNGVVLNDWKGVQAGDHKPLHQCLHEAGYQVGHVGVHHIRVAPSLQERVPFAKWVSNPEYARFFAERHPAAGQEDMLPFRRPVLEKQGEELVEELYSNAQTAVWPYPAEHFKDSYFCDQAVEFIEQQRAEPFALFVYLWAPHPPLRVPEPYASRFDPARLELPPNVGVPAQGEPANRRQGAPAQLAEGLSLAQWRDVWAAHLGLVNLADAGFGRILAALDSTGLSDSTLVVFSADHGDHLGQHSMYQKMEMYEQAVRVPLVFRGPGVRQQVCDTPVSHLDVMPTLLDSLGLDVPDDLDGVSAARTLESGAPPPERPVFCQYSGNPKIGDIRRAVITRRYKYVYDPTDVPELYDLESDPLETRNIASAPEARTILADLHEQAKSWAETHNDWVEF